uniref:Afadin n=1 Tax=Oryzias sinensis TaxID=183150 RepID=A0A8C8DI44_9TELE
MSGTREEERRKLADIINHWNANRLDLFEISQPTEVGSCAAERGGLSAGPFPGSDRGRLAAGLQIHKSLSISRWGVGVCVYTWAFCGSSQVRTPCRDTVTSFVLATTLGGAAINVCSFLGFDPHQWF